MMLDAQRLMKTGEQVPYKSTAHIKSEDEARQQAIDWQNWSSEQSLSYGELSEWQCYFEVLGRKFNLTDEFKENGIL